tara:strand:+ start:104 stop:490 length:387 start_codon:yes stop_codon:yes gene_type:complete
MSRVYKNKKKFINPRYFLNETTNRDLLEESFLPMNLDPAVLAAAKQWCNKIRDIQGAINFFPQALVVSVIKDKAREKGVPVDDIPMIDQILTAAISYYKANGRDVQAVKDAIKKLCSMGKLPDIPLPF